jgi:hypothetical protein
MWWGYGEEGQARVEHLAEGVRQCDIQICCSGGVLSVASGRREPAHSASSRF